MRDDARCSGMDFLNKLVVFYIAYLLDWLGIVQEADY